MKKISDTKNILAIILSLLAIVSAVTYKYFSTSQEDYLKTITKTCQTVAEVKNNLQNAADNLNAYDADQQNFFQVLDTSKEILANENKKLTQLEVPEKYLDANKKIIDCLRTEYNLIDRLKDNFAIQNEYEAAENFSKSKELIIALKEQSAFLNVEGNNFEEVFEFSSVAGKFESYFNSRKQLRYDKDVREQAERERIERERIERERIERERQQAAERQKLFHKTSLMTAEEFQTFYNQNASVLPQYNQIKIINLKSGYLDIDNSYAYMFYTASGFDIVSGSSKDDYRLDGFLITNKTSESNYTENFFWTMALALHTLCNENFIQSADDLDEVKTLLFDLMNRVNRQNDEVKIYYKGKKITFYKGEGESALYVTN